MNERGDDTCRDQRPHRLEDELAEYRLTCDAEARQVAARDRSHRRRDDRGHHDSPSKDLPTHLCEGALCPRRKIFLDNPRIREGRHVTSMPLECSMSTET